MTVFNSGNCSFTADLLLAAICADPALSLNQWGMGSITYLQRKPSAARGLPKKLQGEFFQGKTENPKKDFNDDKRQKEPMELYRLIC